MSLFARRGLILALVLVCGVVVLAVAISQAAAPPPRVAGADHETPTPTPIPCTAGPCRMSLVVTEAAGVVCTPGECTVGTGQKFTLAVDLASVPVQGYILAQSYIEFGTDLSYGYTTRAFAKERAEEIAEEIVWPECLDAVSLRILDDPTTFVGHSCLTGVFPPLPVSDYEGSFVELSLECSAVESSTLVRLVPAGVSPALSNGTQFTASSAVAVVPQVDSLTVNCVILDTPTPGGPDTATPTATPSHTPTGTLTPATATPTPSETPTGTLTPATATPTPSQTPTGTLTPATATPLATPTASQTPAPPTATPIPTNTPTQRPALLGDVSCDGRVDPVDAVLLMQLEAAFIEELPCPDAGDVDGDGQTTLIDATLILQFSAGLISSLPP